MQRLRRLVARRSARQEEGVLVVEGAKLLGEAVQAGAAIESVFVAPGGDGPAVDAAYAAGARVYALAAGVIERVADTTTPQPVAAVVKSVDRPIDALRAATLVVVAVDVRDPGNAGTLLRSAEAAGADGVVCCDGSVDVYNPKTVRASAGSLFHVPVVVGGDPVAVLQQLGGWGLQRLGAAVGAGVAHTAADLTRPTAFVLGNEAHGLPEGVAGELDGLVHIPMAGRAESLNVGVASAVLCFEAARQRRER
ncbi:MAG TPA: RNA methyltransferase [Acidimicrobiales bacterium]|nr:RNA methyltransferase [Acidimicrobiales bacterium]